MRGSGWWGRTSVRVCAGAAASAVLAGLCAQGGMAWGLGFVLLVPWLRSMDRLASLGATLASAWLFSVVFTAAVFWWFGMAIGDYTGAGAATGLGALLLLAPVFQPQFLVYALVRRWARARWGVALGALAGACAWVACEHYVPKMLGDTLGHGLYPALWLRQMADLCGAAGLTVLLLLCNEAWAQVGAGWHTAARAWVRPAAIGVGLPVLAASYGLLSLPGTPAPTAPQEQLRVGLVQANITDYEQRRRHFGTEAVVREVLDTHFAMSYDAVERQQADVVLWSETVYPTTFGQPKSAIGAEFDAAITHIVDAANVPFVFGTYDRDAQGEYNAAAFLQPGTGLLGFYRKTRLFPLTETVPGWLERLGLRQWLAWTGSWQPGNGARVFPLRLRDGREVPVMTAICLDDVDTNLSLDGARLGARALLTLSNDAWFTRYPQGARLHQTVAAFRSIETRLPQYRVTTNGFSALIDPTGTVRAESALGAPALVVGTLPLPASSTTLMTRWGDWVGPLGAALLGGLALLTLATGWRNLRATSTATMHIPPPPAHVFVLSPSAGVLVALLRAVSRLSLLVLGAAMLWDDNLRSNPLAQLRLFAAWFALPETLSWAVLWAYRARVRVQGNTLALERGTQRMEIALADVVRQTLWAPPLPCAGLRLHTRNPAMPTLHLGCRHPVALAGLLAAQGAAALPTPAPGRSLQHHAHVLSQTARGVLDAAWLKYLLFPLSLAVPAFLLHQNIAYGGALGELLTFGARAYLVTLGLWWGAWAMGVFLSAAALRALIEVGTVLVLLATPGGCAPARTQLELLGRTVLYLGLPAWLLLHASW